MQIRYSLLFTANPLSNSRSSISVFRTIRQLDVLSRDTAVFFPGFHTKGTCEADSVSEQDEMLSKMDKYNREQHVDYHGRQPLFHTYCDSVGDMYFNDVDFAKFMQDLEDKCPAFEYWGRTELVVLPSCDGRVLYDDVRRYNLEIFFEPNASHSLEEFVVCVLKLINKNRGASDLSLLDAISDLYRSFEGKPEKKETYTDVLIRMDDEIVNILNWRKEDEGFFISYSTRDEYEAFALKCLLEKHGKQVWIAPDGIPSGFDYACAIPAAMRITSRFVLLLSHNSSNSAWVRREIAKAISTEKQISVVLLKGFKVDDLRKYDHLDFLLESVQIRYDFNELFDDEEIRGRFLNYK